MGKFKKHGFKGKKRFNSHTTKKKTSKETDTIINKKAIFNRYKDKQKVKEELEKKKQLEHKLQEDRTLYSDDDDEENPYELLLSTFNKKFRQNIAVETDESDCDSEEFHNDKSNDHLDVQNGHNDDSLEDNQNELDVNDESTDESEDADIDMDCKHNYKNISNDPFTKHIEYDLGDELLVSVSNSPPTVEEFIKTWPTLGTLHIHIPKCVEINKIKPKFSILNECVYAEPGRVPQICKKVDFKDLHIKSQVHENIANSNRPNLIKNDLEPADIFTPLQKELFAIMNNYQDLYYPYRTFSNAEEIRYMYCLHAINHMLKTRLKILHHNTKLSKKTNLLNDYRDQGFVRPKVLIMVPFKSSAYKVVKTLIDILVHKNAQQRVDIKRFEAEFTGGELIMPKKNPKPEDYELLFSGNTDDTFTLGMSLRKKSLKLYTDFYSSDIILASPLALRLIVGSEGDEDRDYDFLASIELLIMDQADVFIMQNWDHLLHVLNHFHLQPKKTHDADFSRLRSWAANGWSKYYRQTLIFSSILMIELKSIFNKSCQNYAGKVNVKNSVDVGTISQVLVQMPQIFHRFNATSPLSAAEIRFQYFIKELLPKQLDTMLSHTLIYVPSYFDYVRLRNHLKKQDIGFVQICEYSKDNKIARARDMFFHTEAHFLLYSERVHFFKRLRIKGIRHIMFYQPPTYPHFYSEMCNLMMEFNQNKYGGCSINMSVTVLYSQYDAYQLEGILGTSRVGSMLHSDESIHVLTCER